MRNYSQYDFEFALERGEVALSDGLTLGDCAKIANATRAALSIMARVQAGELAVVPVVADDKMINAGESLEYFENGYGNECIAFYNAMLKAAPSIEELLGEK